MTPILQFNKLPHSSSVGGMPVKGEIYPRGKCPVCGGKFARDEKGYSCPIHLIRPERYYIQLYDRELHKHINIFSFNRKPLRTYEDAKTVLGAVRTDIERANGHFDASRYVAEKLKPLRFSNWSKEWLKKKRTECEKGLLAPSYLKPLGVYVRKYQAFFGEIDIRDIGTKRIYEFYLSLSGAPHYIKNIITALEKLFRDAMDWGDIAAMPKFPKIEVPEPETPVIDLDMQDKIIQAIPNPMDRAFILFTARLMLRPCEPRALQWSDVDLKHSRVTIRRHFSLNRICPATKSKRIKVRLMDEEVKQTLLGLPRHLTSPFVFWKGDGHPFSESWARKVWTRAKSALGVNVSLYQGTRHSSATEAADRVGVDAVQEFLDHTSRRTTMRYVRSNPERLRKVLRSR